MPLILNFLYVADDVYYEMMRISIISVIKHHKDAEIVFHVFTMDSPETGQSQISSKNKEKLKREICILDPTAQIIFYDVRDMYLEKLANSVNKHTEFTPYAALRLLAPYILQDVDMLVYVDADTIVVDRIGELFTDHRGEDFDFAALKDIYRYPVPNYISFLSGLLLLNLRYQRQNKLRFVDEVIRLYNSTIFAFPDQDAISLANPSDRFFLPNNYLQYCYTPGNTKILCINYRNKVAIAPFLQQSVFKWDAKKISANVERIAQAVSNIQNNVS